MAELTEPQKLEIVEALACFRAPSDIIAHFRREYDLELTHMQVGGYDPTRPYYFAGDKWREIFDAKRKGYLEEVAVVPVANQGFRLNELHDMYVAAKKAKNYALAAQLLEQSAKEVGGVLTNERNLKVDYSRSPRPSDMTPEDRKAALAELIRQAIESAPARLAAPQPGSTS